MRATVADTTRAAGTAESRQPHLQVVRSLDTEVTVGDDSTSERPPLDERRVWRAAALGAVTGCVIFGIVTAFVARLTGLDSGGALGVGTFVGMTGGVGFGFMMGALVTFARDLEPKHLPGSTKHNPPRTGA